MNEEKIAEQKRLYDAYRIKKVREQKKRPLQKGILIFDEVKVQSKVRMYIFMYMYMYCYCLHFQNSLSLSLPSPYNMYIHKYLGLTISGGVELKEQQNYWSHHDF